MMHVLAEVGAYVFSNGAWLRYDEAAEGLGRPQRRYTLRRDIEHDESPAHWID